MKKLLKRIIVIAFVAVLFTAPSTALAASTPVLQVEDDGFKYFLYEPEPYYLAGNNSTFLKDTTTSDGWWRIPAGRPFYTNVYLNEPGTYRVIISKEGTGVVYDSGIITEFTSQAVFPPLTKDAKYLIWITAYTNINIMAYDGIFYND